MDKKWSAILIIILTAGFIAVWMLPLFFPVGSLIRYAFEEMRVLITGIIIGVFIGCTLYSIFLMDDS